MEYRSERLRKGRGTQTPEKLGTVYYNNIKTNTKNNERFIYQNLSNNPLVAPDETERKANSRLWDFLRQLYSVFLSCILKPLLKCIIGITCHEEEDRCRRNRNSRQQHKFEISSPQQSHHSEGRPLFSSDDEFEDEDNECFEQSEVNEYLIDDYELPLVQKVDTLLHFLNLYGTNYPAFKHEAVKYAQSGHNLSGEQCQRLKEERRSKRPFIFQRAVRVLRKRELRTRMTRVHGNEHKKWVLKWTLASRIAILLLQMLTTNFWEFLKHENDGFKFTPEESYGKWLDPLVNSTLGGYVNWDAHYFLHITVYGYTSENMMAFFPLYPMILSVPSYFVYSFFGSLISLSSLVIIFAALVNTWLFIKCTENIYELAMLWSDKTEAFVTTSCLFFAFNPASIFFSGLYTETLFAYLTSKVLLSLFEGKYWTAILSASLSGLCRSNGLLNIGFVIAFSLEKQLNSQRRRFSILAFVISSCLNVLLGAIPFLLFQIYGISAFCEDGTLYEANPSHIPLYCVRPSKHFLLPTLPYSYIQNKYWNVGFLKYFQFKQIPNFMLALPALILLGSESYAAFKQTVSHMLTKSTLHGLYFALQALHGLFLTTFCFLFVHVQVSTRMIMAACPYLFMYMADKYNLEIEGFKRDKNNSLPKRSFGLILWCALYFFVGAVAFSSGLPWT